MATMEQKIQYIVTIEKIMEGSMKCNNVCSISDEVIKLMDMVLDKISESSRAFLATDTTFSYFYNLPGSWAETLVAAANSGPTRSVEGWIDALRGSNYRLCVATAAEDYKYPVQLALYGV